MNLFSRKKVERSAMSDFIRNASSAKKNKIYREVLIKATKRQEDVIKRVASGRLTQSGS
jgi:predicted CopG family antitoxin